MKTKDSFVLDPKNLDTKRSETLKSSEKEAIETKGFDTKLNSFDNIIELVGDNGWRNYAIFFAASLTGMVSAIPVFSYQFLGATPAHWCEVDVLAANNWTADQIKQIAIPYTVHQKGEREYDSCSMYDLNYNEIANVGYEKAMKMVHEGDVERNKNETITCTQRQFEDHVETIVNKWDLVCERRFLYSTTQAAVQGGMLVGSFFMGYLVDMYGRRYMYRIAVVWGIVSDFIIAFSPTIYFFIGMRLLRTVVSLGAYMAAFVLCMELCSVRQRTRIATLYVIPWAIGVMLTSGIAYLVRPWHNLQISFSIPGLLLLISCWILPESPRWLIVKGRHDEALEVLKGLAKSSKRDIPKDKIMLEALERIQSLTTQEKEEKNEKLPLIARAKSSAHYLMSGLIDPKMRYKTLGIFYCWFSVAMVYYGVSLGSTTLSTNDYMYIFLSGVIEIPCYLLLWPVMVFLGRRNALIVCFTICALSIFGVLALVLTDVVDNYSSLRLAMFLGGKFAITAAFHLIWIYTAELYPTKFRSLMVGESSTVARLGSICSPYVNDILGAKIAWSPAALFGGFSIVAASVCLIFPETGGKEMSDSNENPSSKVESSKEEDKSK